MCKKKTFVWSSARFCTFSVKFQFMCFERVLCVCMWHRSLLVHRCSKSGGSPAVCQIGTPDLCLCHPLICPPRCTIIPPLPTCADRWRLHWGVLDLHCTVGWRSTGSDRIKPDSLCACVCLGAGKSYRYRRGFFGNFHFSDSGSNESHTYLMSKHFKACRFQVILIIFSRRKLHTVQK